MLGLDCYLNRRKLVCDTDRKKGGTRRGFGVLGTSLARFLSSLRGGAKGSFLVYGSTSGSGSGLFCGGSGRSMGGKVRCF